MIVVTGAAGFIGSCMIKKLNLSGHTNIIAVDEFSRADKNVNLDHKAFAQKMDRMAFLDWFKENHADVSFMFHLGARTDTTEKEVAIFDELNLNYSKTIWEVCTKANIPMVYASSAATYGIGELGYKDDHDIIHNLKPLNPYGQSKNDFDIWALQQTQTPPQWAGMKFFNVYGPNEYHKGRMASVIFHTVRQIKKTGGMKLFRSHRDDYEDGQQSRDFVYVKDVVDVLYFFHESFAIQNRSDISGLYNLGTGKARSFWDLASNTFRSMDLEPNISFIDTPIDIRDTYQYFTEADMEKLKSVGYDKSFHDLERGIDDYVRNYLKDEAIF
ncbi:MAG: ADP-glyceromanno-heptose 6-epimerase [Bacteroidota bacterium]